MTTGPRQDTAYGVHAIATASEAQRRFVPVFLGQVAHRRSVHIRRITDDQLIATTGQAVEQIGLCQSNPLLQFIVLDVQARHL